MRQQQFHNEAPSWCVMEANDADLHAHNLRDWQQQYDQISAGRFYGRIDEVVFPHLQVFREHTSQALHQQCNVWPDSVWLGFSADRKDCRINGQLVTADEIMCRPGNCQFELITPENFDIYGVVVSHEALLDTARRQQIEVDAGMWSAARFGWDPEKLNRLRFMLSRQLQPGYASMAGGHQQDMFLTTVLEVLQQERPAKRETAAWSRRRAVVQQVQDYLHESPSADVTITGLCELTHVSRRTLQYSFETVLGISPLRFLRVSRLNHVRRELLAGGNSERTIAETAARWGFWHAGQFAHDYKELFGENPSQTTGRAK